MPETIEVWRGKHGDPVPLFGPLPGVRIGDTLAYEFQLPPRYQPWPERSLLERVFVLLDLGVSMSVPGWQYCHVDERRVDGVDADVGHPGSWYVDLVQVDTSAGTVIVRDLYLDVIVPLDGRHQRLLDLDEFGDAIEAGSLDLATAVDGMRRWQQFRDRHLHIGRNPSAAWTDFPPARIRELAALPAPLGPVVTSP